MTWHTSKYKSKASDVQLEDITKKILNCDYNGLEKKRCSDLCNYSTEGLTREVYFDSSDLGDYMLITEFGNPIVYTSANKLPILIEVISTDKRLTRNVIKRARNYERIVKGGR